MSVLIYLETSDGKLRSSAPELATAGKKLAGMLGTDLVAAVVGDTDLTSVKEFGITNVIHLSSDKLNSYSGDLYATAIAETVDKCGAKAILMMASAQGKDLAPRVGARKNVSVISSVIDLVQQDSVVAGLRPVFAGKARVMVKPTADPAIYTIRPKAFTPEVGALSDPATETFTPDLSDARAIVNEIVQAAGAKLDLTEADVIVSGGRGMGDGDKYEILEVLAEQLGGVVGASRAAVDSGWRPHSDQVGQTGKTVAPTLYIACGISGAIQHLAGMSSAKCIVAINKDPDAPIFKIADYGIVGDLFEVVPALSTALK